MLHGAGVEVDVPLCKQLVWRVDHPIWFWCHPDGEVAKASSGWRSSKGYGIYFEARDEKTAIYLVGMGS